MRATRALCIVIALVGAALLVAGAILNYGPLSLPGALCMGFATGGLLARRATLDALEDLNKRGRQSADRRQ